MEVRIVVLPRGDREAGWERFPYAALVLHITREVVHHGAEVLLLRDLHRQKVPGAGLEPARGVSPRGV